MTRREISDAARRAVAAGLTVAVAFGAAACGHDAGGPPALVERHAPARDDGPPLPAGASVEHYGEHAANPQSTENLVGSLRPDGRTARERIPTIVQRGRLIVGVDQSLFLLSFRDPQSGELRGFEVELAREFARDIFGDPDRVEFRFLESAQRREAIAAGQVDMVLRSTSITEERQETMAFSVPYLRAQMRLLVQKEPGISGPADLGGRTVCVADGSTGLEHARADAEGATLLKTRNWSDCLVALQQNQADAILADDTMLSGIAAQDDFTEIVGEPLTREYYGAAMAQPEAPADESDEAAGLIRQVNETLRRVTTDGTWQRLYDRWFGPYLPAQSPPPAIYREEEAQ
ncbi:glutamate ABC transporter substrate-binding protein [Corynebacterium frankenforstense]|uniref:glutamate ABC transporter substrate-binding protein n=1 Tax=Corynebacterium frankenforstense TaxID=1230998 RepID=UPI0026EE3937|nr:glutamate ABC transporter substrate-binding protein [Corynebacterium frankenforstense]